MTENTAPPGVVFLPRDQNVKCGSAARAWLAPTELLIMLLRR
jgi:hypothetical protein